MQLYPDTATPRFFTVQGGEEYRDVNFLVAPHPAYGLSGRIELPEPNAQFQLALGLPEQPLLPIAQTLTEKDGSFRFDKVPAGAYDLFAAGPVNGYTAYASILRAGRQWFGRTRVQVIAQDVEGVAVPVAAARSLNVVLRAHASDKPPEGCPASAAVMVEPLEPWAILFTASAQAAFGKEQSVGNLPPGRFRLSATNLGAGCYQVGQAVADLSGDMTTPLAIEMASAGAIRGTLKTGSARAVDFAVVLLPAANTDGAQARLAYADDQGRFAFDALPPGRYRLAAHPRAGASKARWVADTSRMVEIEVAGGAPTPIELPVEVKGERQ
jgi:hypothetical protein